jgi:hypothetical protein
MKMAENFFVFSAVLGHWDWPVGMVKQLWPSKAQRGFEKVVEELVDERDRVRLGLFVVLGSVGRGQG